MRLQSKNLRRNNRGTAYLLAVLILAMMVSLSIAFASQTSMNLAKGENFQRALEARMAAESGLAFMMQQLRAIRVRDGATGQDMATDLAQRLSDRLNGTADLNGQTVSCSGNTVTVPPIASGGQSFTCLFTWTSNTDCTLQVTGAARDLTRRIAVDFAMTVKRSGVFDYGFASKGQINVGGHSRLIGVNTPSEASILSATTSSAEAITVDGNATITGDLSVVGSPSSVLIKGTPVIGNTNDPAQWAQHCHFGVQPPDWPEYDTSVLAPLATTLIDSTNYNNYTTLNNIRIKAGTNPTFADKTVINGIVYVEAPNKVTFAGQATVNGMIVTQTGASTSDCQINFTGGVDAYGVDVLPNTDQFAAVKQQQGTFVLAPGFALTFAGNVQAVNGNIAADQLTFTGTATGTVRGSIIGLADVPSIISGTVDIYVDRQNAEQDPAGFVKTYQMAPLAGTYREVTGGS